MRVACLQMSSSDDVQANLETVSALLDRAAGEGAALAVLPEMFAFLHPSFARKSRFAENSAEQRVLPFLAQSAVRHGMALIGGSLLLPGRDGRLRNSCPVYAADGTCLGIYDKIHLFDVDLPDRSYHESHQIVGGATPRIVDLNDWRVGLSICYDLRFPELYRYYAARGATLLPVPSAFTVPTGEVHWELLLRARAVENQAYVLAAAQIGRHPGGRTTYGHSMIVDPWGTVLARAENRGGRDGECVLAEIHTAEVDRVRARMPVLEHRRPELFPPLDGMS